jgi:glutamyl-tRNA reductase
LHRLKVISFSHKKTPLKELSRFILHDENRKERLEYIKYSCDLGEILYIPTCNRIEFVFTTHHSCSIPFLEKFFRSFRQDWNANDVKFALENAVVYENEFALNHLYRVASSLESLVVGEREIITQVRKAYDICNSEGLTGDFLRLVIKSTITTAKQVYTYTKIAANPVSVVSLAERKLRDMEPEFNSRILVIGAGETNSNLCKYLVKHGFSDFVVFNRTLANAEKFAKMIAASKIKTTAFPLEQLKEYKEGFDILIVCTASVEKIITPEIYSSLLNGDKGKKIIIDLSVPSNIHPSILEDNNIHLIDISQLKAVAEKNKTDRQNEIAAAEEVIDENMKNFRHMHRTRRLEIKMKDVPEKIRQIKHKAIYDVFADDINSLDDRSKEVLERVLDYMERKCISVPMVMAKEIILETSN